MALVLSTSAGFPFCIAQNHNPEQVKPIVDKRETWDFAALNRDPKRKRADIVKELWFSPPTVCMVFGKRRRAEADSLIVDSKTREAWEESMWTCALNFFRGSNNSIAALDMLRRYFRLQESVVFENSFRNIDKELFGQSMFDLTF